MAQQIQIRRDTSTNWTTANPILAQGEFGLETNTGKLKIGNGTSNWNSLAYFGGAGALASLTDVSFNSLVSGQIPVANASGTFINQSLSSLVRELAFASLGSLSVMNQLSYGSILNLPALGSLAPMNQLSFTSLTNQPSLSSLAFQSTIDYTTAQLTNKPALGSLAVMNQLSFTSLLNQPSLGSLAFVNSLTKSDVGLGNVTNDAQLKIASNLSDLNNVATARGNLSLGSLAVQNTAIAQLGSTASIDILYSNGIVNFSGVSTNTLNSINLVNASTITTNILASIGLINSSTVSTNLLRSNDAMFASTVSMQLLRGNALVIASTASIRNIRGFTGTWSDLISAKNFTGASYGINNGDQTMPFWGDGADGTVSLDGGLDSQTLPFITYDTTTSTYTLTRDLYAYDLTVNLGYTLITAGYRIFCANSLTNNGVIHNNGYNASGASAGAGGFGGFFRAGNAGANGLSATTSGASGIFPPLPTAFTFLGNVGGRGANGRSGTTASAGQNNSLSSLTFPIYGGKQLVGNYYTYIEPTIQANVSVSTFPTFSQGGGAGAKSAVGTTALSGGGGGGGGVVFLASPIMNSTGTITALGGNGGNATGTGGVFGGGGGGAGGIVVLHYSTSNTMGAVNQPIVIGGTGGSSAGNANTLAVGRSDGSVYLSTATIQNFSFIPNQVFNNGSYYIMSIHMTFNAGQSVGFNAGSVTGFNCTWSQLADVRFNTIANPTRALFVFKGRPINGTSLDQLQNNRIVAKCVGVVNTVRIIIDEIQNTSEWEGIDPSSSNATNSSDSATTAVTNLGVTPTTNNMQYSVVATSGGTGFTAGTGLTLLNTAGSTAPILQSGVAISRASSSITWTTASAYGMFTIDLNQPTAQETGRTGFDGKVLQFYA